MSFLIPPPPPVQVKYPAKTQHSDELGPLYLESSRLTVWCHFVFHWHKAMLILFVYGSVMFPTILVAIVLPYSFSFCLSCHQD